MVSYCLYLLSQWLIYHPASQLDGFKGIAIETQVLRNRGNSKSIILTMLKAKKSSSHKDYRSMWKAYFAQGAGFHIRKFCVRRILAFLQIILDQHLALSFIKGQVFALAICFPRPLDSHSLVKTFVSHMAPPVHPLVSSWDLNLILSVLQKKKNTLWAYKGYSPFHSYL